MMMEGKDRHSRLAKLIRTYNADKDGAAFRNAFKAAAEAAEPYSDRRDILFGLRSQLEAWSKPGQVDADAATAAWIELYDAHQTWLSPAVFDALLIRLPKQRVLSRRWERLILGTDRRIVESLLAKRLVKTSDLKSIAIANPEAFLASAAFDVWLQRGASCPKQLWAKLDHIGQRPSHLMPRNQAIVSCYRYGKGTVADKGMLAVIDRPILRCEVLEAVLDDPATARRLLDLLVATAALPNNRKSAKVRTNSRVALSEWVSIIETELHGTRAPRTAGAILGSLRLSLLFNSTVLDGEVSEHISTVSIDAASRALLQADSQIRTRDSGPVLVVAGAELHDIINRFLNAADTAGERGGSPGKANIAFNENFGVSNLARELIALTDRTDSDLDWPGEIQAVLFNHGIRPLGEMDATVRFDPRAHQPCAPGILRGDPVVVRKAGAWLPATGVVLALPLVEPLSSEEP